MKIDYEKAYHNLSMLPMRDETFRGILSIALQEKQEREKGCSYCKVPCGKDIKINVSPNNFIQPDSAAIIQSKSDKPEMVLFKNNMASGCFYINFCSMCGRKLLNPPEVTEW